MRPRPYQESAIQSVVSAFESHQSALIVLPTGAGKTIIFAHLCKQMMSRGRCMVLAHREELIHQAASKIQAVTGIKPDIEMADRYANESGYLHDPSPIVVSSIQTQNSGQRMRRFVPNQFSFVVVDEAHHAPAATYRKVIGWYEQNPSLRVLGVTATPDRADELALGQVFKVNPFVYEINNAIDDGWLVPVHQRYIVCEGLDFSEIRTTAGDLNAGDLAGVVEAERAIHEMVSPTIDLVGSRKTLFFAVSVAQAERTAEIFNRHRPGMARCVFGHTPKEERRETLRDYSDGAFQVLVNVGVATEGFDEPTIAVVAVGRPTKSRALYCQMIGRGTRPLTGTVDPFETPEERIAAIKGSDKPSVLVLDFVGNSGKHKLISTADVLGGKYDEAVIAEAKRIAKKKGGDICEALEEAEQNRLLMKAKEASRRAKVRAQAKYAAKDVDPFEKHRPAYNVTPRWYWKFRPATEKQKALLMRRGLYQEGMTIQDASAAIDELARREHWRPRATA